MKRGVVKIQQNRMLFEQQTVWSCAKIKLHRHNIQHQKTERLPSVT